MLNDLPVNFWIINFIVLIIFCFGIFNPEFFVQQIGVINKFLFDKLGTFYLWFALFALILFLGIGISPLGKIRLGGQDDKPAYSNFSWFSMLFCAGMGVSIMFWGVVEPLYHFMNPPVAGLETSLQKEITSFKFSFLHWGFHPWAIYGLTTLAVCFFTLNLKKNLYFSAFFSKLNGLNLSIKKKILKNSIDLSTLLAILFGVVYSFGMGVLSIEGGLNKLFGIESSLVLQIGIIVVIFICYMISCLRGLNKGIKVLSNISMILCFILLGGIFCYVPKMEILGPLVNALPAYLAELPRLSLANFDFSNADFPRVWTIMYWTWWIAWAPFVGIFVALISKGRTVRQLVFSMLLAPTIFSFTWFAVFGKGAIFIQNKFNLVGDSFDLANVNTVLFNMLDLLTQASFFSWLTLIILFIFFINSADSATYTLASLTQNKAKQDTTSAEAKTGSHNPTTFLQVGWGVMIAFLTMIFMFSGGIKILQQVTLITVPPFSILLCVVFIKLVYDMCKYYKYEQLRSNLKRNLGDIATSMESSEKEKELAPLSH